MNRFRGSMKHPDAKLLNQCVNFTDNLDLDTPIYRTMPIERLIQILESRKLTLMKPKKWEDPFENSFLLSKFILDGKPVNLNPRKSIYGLCWTIHQESDAIWRIYSHDKRGVTVKTTPRKLLKSLNAAIGAFSSISCFIGKVKYLEKTEIYDEYKKIAQRISQSDGKPLAESLLYKRAAFNHENEVRLLYHEHDKDCENDLFQFDINPYDLFDQIMFDPRLDRSIYDIYKDGIVKLGFTGKIIKSILYDMPEKDTYHINL